MRRFARLSAAIAFAAAVVAQDPREMQIRTEPVRGNVHVLYGQGGNIGLSVGADGTFLIDSQFAPQTGRILDAVAKLTDQPPRLLLNTHWHFDHTGGNENLAKAGALILAHGNVRRLLSTDQVMQAFGRKVPASPPAALPAVTFADALELHWNGDRLRLFHLGPAHTDGDVVVQFERANVFHLGDLYLSASYPFIDVQNGGSIDGMVAACDAVLARTDAESRLIPGHGPVTGVPELRQYRDMLAQVGKNVHALVDAGKSRQQVIDGKPTAAYDAKWGQGFMQPDVWVGIVHDGITAAKQRRQPPGGQQPRRDARTPGR